MTVPRPGHADLTAAIKYGYRDLRPALERASARETTGARRRRRGLQGLPGAVRHHGGRLRHHHRRRGAALPPHDLPYDERFALAEDNDVRCPDPDVAEAMRRRSGTSMQAQDTLGGVFEIVALGVPPGLGSHVHFDRG